MIFKKLFQCALPCAFALIEALAPSPAGAQIRLQTEDVDLKIGFQGQFWADWTQDSTAGTQGYQQNLYLRRARILLSADIGSDLSVFFQTDSPNLGKTPKSTTAGFMLQDAFLEWKPAKAIYLDAGLLLVPFARNALQSTLSYYALDISSITTVNNSATQSAALRDLGFQARGFVLNNRLQYRLGAFQGERDSNARNSLRTAGYLQYDFFATETGYTMIGTALGKKKILAIDVGADKQGSYRALSANTAFDIPVHQGDEIGGQYQFIHYDGRRKFVSIQDQNDWFVEGDYYLHQIKTQPFVKFEQQRFVAAANSAKDVDRLGAGVNVYIHSQNLKWTLQYNRLLPQNGSPLKCSNEITMQLQLFYF